MPPPRPTKSQPRASTRNSSRRNPSAQSPRHTVPRSTRQNPMLVAGMTPYSPVERGPVVPPVAPAPSARRDPPRRLVPGAGVVRGAVLGIAPARHEEAARLDALERPEVGPETTDGVLRVKLDEIIELIAAHPARAHAQRGGEPGRRRRGRSGRRGKVQLDPLAVAIGGQGPAPCVETRPAPPRQGGRLPPHLSAREPRVNPPLHPHQPAAS